MSSTSDNITKKEKDSSVINSVEEDISEENEFDLESDEFSAEEQQALSDEELKQKRLISI
ncbi:MAG: hypothetical protein IPP52_00115 [Ignavibacteria bacterium]|nr:hypothetical protein [Ignavibacteria bacterium]